MKLDGYSNTNSRNQVLRLTTGMQHRPCYVPYKLCQTTDCLNDNNSLIFTIITRISSLITTLQLLDGVESACFIYSCAPGFT